MTSLRQPENIIVI